MSIYRRDDVSPAWEPIPWDIEGATADAQELGFHERAMKRISWLATPFDNFPQEGIFGQSRDWFVSNEIAFYATFNSEDLILIQNTWHGFPDPPEWRLASRPVDRASVSWSEWGHFSDLPALWNMPRM
ncbi:hypothetical protein J2S30_004542 [Herbaspirillum rubrisubalbicans]|uniref:hypothetical protein n=1 Tax=Herbaspirillum rubrisubalbicans TaxID=80842 RepID=UPI00209D3F1E|nr:hypothetical protein [Herbaspirillum rubrisubalbicans]MCP1576163.1 hypothetical protein [Herbaspirillum rubrisubalbicans]